MVRKALFDLEFRQALEERLDQADQLMYSEAYSDSVNQIPHASLAASLPQTNAPDGSAAVSDADATSKHTVQTTAGPISVQGNVLLCECPDCGSPMTVRMWLELADCWRCETSIQLTTEQIDAARLAATQATTVVSPPEPSALLHVPDDEDVFRPTVAATSPTNPNPNPNPDTSSLDELDRLTESSLAARMLRRGLSMVPAWLISALLHLFLILILALIVLSTTEVGPTITLSSFINPDINEGGEIRISNLNDVLVDDLEMAAEMDIGAEEIREVIEAAKKDAADLVIDRQPTMPLPDLDRVKKNITTRPDQLMSFAARDPRVRAEMVRKEGGTTLTEAAVARGLRWLASVQNEDGSWSLDDYDSRNRKRESGDAAATSLAMLPFLGAGQTHEYGKYKQVVAKGLAWLINNQKPDGDLRINFPGQAGMYAHGQGAIVLCEALAMTGDEQLRDPAQRAIDFIEHAQHRRGGWRYKPGQEGDTSVLGWHLMAIQSARAPNVGLNVSPETLQLADYFLDQAAYARSFVAKSPKKRSGVTMPRGSLYTYQPRQGKPKAAMTAEAMLCRMYLGWRRDDPRVKAAVKWLGSEHQPSVENKNIYYWYYGTQVMHHFGGSDWERWNKRMREILVSTQEKRGWKAGSWSPSGYQWGSQGRRIYVTSLAVCTLEIYYRHLPIFAPVELD